MKDNGKELIGTDGKEASLDAVARLKSTSPLFKKNLVCSSQNRDPETVSESLYLMPYLEETKTPVKHNKIFLISTMKKKRGMLLDAGTSGGRSVGVICCVGG